MNKLNILLTKMRIEYLISKLYTRIYNTLYELFHLATPRIVINSTLCVRGRHLIKHNFGDDLNFFLLKELTGIDYIINQSDTFIKHDKVLVAIGSIIEWKTLPNAEIWGAGAMWGGNHTLPYKPKKVWAVRGKYSRDYLLDKGVEVPATYGDPALILPYVYKPEKYKKYKIGFIPHYTNQGDENLKRLVEEESGCVKVIDLARYNEWTNVIDEINNCDVVFSSSLHGLIISDAYNIPNVWISFSDNISGGYFKYLDYFSSVGRIDKKPIKITEEVHIKELLLHVQEWKPIQYNIKPLLDSFPYPLNNIVLKKQ